jgi:hypothetical protein
VAQLVGSTPLDTDRYAVLGIDWLGGAGASSADAGAGGFPAVDARDQAALAPSATGSASRACTPWRAPPTAAWSALRSPRSRQQALGSVTRHQHRAHRSNALATGWRSIQRAIVRHSLALGDGPANLARRGRSR